MPPRGSRGSPFENCWSGAFLMARKLLLWQQSWWLRGTRPGGLAVSTAVCQPQCSYRCPVAWCCAGHGNWTGASTHRASSTPAQPCHGSHAGGWPFEAGGPRPTRDPEETPGCLPLWPPQVGRDTVRKKSPAAPLSKEARRHGQTPRPEGRQNSPKRLPGPPLPPERGWGSAARIAVTA